jgi:alcohol dehydrogenase, propanol-preferring
MALVDFEKVNVVEEVKNLTGGGGPYAGYSHRDTSRRSAWFAHLVRSLRWACRVALALAWVFLMPSLEKSPLRAAMCTISLASEVRGNRADTEEAVEFMERGKVKVSYEKGGLSELAKVYEEMERGDIVGRIVLDNF